MRQFLTILLATITVLGLAACKNPDGGPQKPAGGHYDQ